MADDLFPFFDTNGTTTWCSLFQTYMRDIDISPDGSYFVVVTTGAFRANRLCDSINRFELTTTGPNQTPTWTDWTGGDTSWSVSVSGTAVYVGGHMRWVNNPYRGDVAGPGAVPARASRPLSAQRDPLHLEPRSRARGRELHLPVTPDGLWVGSDTDHAGNESHQKISFFPRAGGTTPPPDVTYPLPNDLYNMDQAGVGALNRRLLRPDHVRFHVHRAPGHRLAERARRIHVERQPLLRDERRLAVQADDRRHHARRR